MNIITFSSCETNGRERFWLSEMSSDKNVHVSSRFNVKQIVIKTNYAFSARTLRKFLFSCSINWKHANLWFFFYSLIKSSTFNALRFFFKLMMCYTFLSRWDCESLNYIFSTCHHRKKKYIIALNKLLKVKTGSIAAFF